MISWFQAGKEKPDADGATPGFREQQGDRSRICCPSLVAAPLNPADRTVASSNDGGPAAASTLVSAEALCPAIAAVTAVIVTVSVIAWAANIYAHPHTSGPSTNINILR
jgi:hypothetical protein